MKDNLSVKPDKGDFTRGSIVGNILRMAAPISLALLVNVLYSTVDRIYIGHIPGTGRLALTGIGLVSPIISMITAFQRLWGSGSSPLFAIKRGERDDAGAGEILRNACFMQCVTGLALTVVLQLFGERILRLIGASQETLPYAREYLRIYSLGIVFTLFALGLNPFIHAQGRPRIGMMTVVIGAVINIVLDPLFIFVFDMGVRGAAIATVIGQMCSAGWILLIMRGERLPVRLSMRDYRPDRGIIKSMFSLGITEFTFSLTTSLSLLVRNVQLRTLGGDIYVSCMTILSTIHELFVMATHGLTDATKPIVSYNYGAKRYDRVRKAILTLTGLVFGYLMVVWAFTRLAPDLIVKLFCDDEALMEPCKEAIHYYFMAIFMLAFQTTSQSMSVALRRGRQALLLSLFRKVVLVIGLTLLLPGAFGLGVRGVFLSEPVSDIVGGLTSYTVMIITVILPINKKLRETPA